MGSTPDRRAPDTVRRQRHELIDEAGRIVGDRYAESRTDPDGGLRMTVIDLCESDATAITDVARRLGVEDWIRLERADPTALENWEALRLELLRLGEVSPRVLQGYPTPTPRYRRPPVAIHLKPDTEAVAADLHDRFGDFVSLEVGALPYPPELVVAPPDLARSARDLAPVAPTELLVVLDGPLAIRSGRTATHHVLVTNLSSDAISIATSGNLYAKIVDPDTGATIGGYAGAIRLPLVRFGAEPTETVRIPLVVGTASYVMELGYAVPAGDWQLTAELRLEDGRVLVTPPLPLTITG
jgi:hypothetical protein